MVGDRYALHEDKFDEYGAAGDGLVSMKGDVGDDALGEDGSRKVGGFGNGAGFGDGCVLSEERISVKERDFP